MKAKLTINNQELEIDISQEQLEKIQLAHPKTNGKRWKPNFRESYFCISLYGFKTAKELTKHLEYLNAKAAILDHADEVNEGWIFGAGSNGCEVFWNNRKGILDIINIDNNIYSTIVIYKSQAAAQDSIDKLEKEWMIVLGVEE